MESTSFLPAPRILLPFFVKQDSAAGISFHISNAHDLAVSASGIFYNIGNPVLRHILSFAFRRRKNNEKIGFRCYRSCHFVIRIVQIEYDDVDILGKLPDFPQSAPFPRRPETPVH